MKKMIVIGITVSIICLLLATYTCAETKNCYHEESAGSNSDEVYRIRIAWSDIEKAPTWIPGGDEPPFGIKQAAQNAKDYVQQNLSQFSNSFIKSVTLNCINTLEGCKDKWYYLITLKNFNTKNPDKPYLIQYTEIKSDISIIVLMDGNVPEVLVEKRTQPRDVYTTTPAPTTPGPRVINSPIPAAQGSRHMEN